MRLASVFAHAPVGIATLRARRTCLKLPTAGTSMSSADGLSKANPFETRFRSSRGRASRVPRRRVSIRRAIRGAFRSRHDPASAHARRRRSSILCISRCSMTRPGRRASRRRLDVTELTNARRDAEAANRAKDEFLAMLGHECATRWRRSDRPATDAAARRVEAPSASARSSSGRLSTWCRSSMTCSTCRGSLAGKSNLNANGSTSRISSPRPLR